MQLWFVNQNVRLRFVMYDHEIKKYLKWLIQQNKMINYAKTDKPMP